jgi:hypothetical protein
MISKKFEQLLVDANISPEMKMSIEGALKGLKGEELETFCEIPEFRKALEELLEAVVFFETLTQGNSDDLGNLKKLPGAVFRVSRAIGSLRSAGKKAEKAARKAKSKDIKPEKALKAISKERKRAMKARIKEAKAAAKVARKEVKEAEKAQVAAIRAEFVKC